MARLEAPSKRVGRRFRSEFPTLDPSMEKMHDNIHEQVGVFRLFVQEAIDRGDRDLLKKAFAFVDESLRDPNLEVRNAIAVSFLEALDMRGPARRYALTLLPSAVRAEREAALGYHHQLTGHFRWEEEAQGKSEPKPKSRKRGGAA